MTDVNTEFLDRRIRAVFDELARGGGGGGMDAWQQTVETRLGDLREDVRDLRSDFRWTWGGLALGFVTLGGMLIAGYLRLADQLNDVLQKLPHSWPTTTGRCSPTCGSRCVGSIRGRRRAARARPKTSPGGWSSTSASAAGASHGRSPNAATPHDNRAECVINARQAKR